MGAILYLVSVPAAQIFILTGISEPCLPFTAFCEETSTVTPDFLSYLFIYLFIFCLVLSVFFFQVFSKNSLIKNIFEEEKRLIVEHDFFWKIVLYWFIWAGPRQGRQANHGTVQKSAISPHPGNQKRLKWSNAAYLNKKSFIFWEKIVCFK